MKSIREKMFVRGPQTKVFDALTQQAGYLGWWSKDCKIADKAGGESTLKFNKDGNIVTMRFRLDEAAPHRSVRWTCVAHDMAPWIGTTLKWDLAPSGDLTELSFEHDGWKSDPPEQVVSGWRHFVASLRSYVETGQGQPW